QYKASAYWWGSGSIRLAIEGGPLIDAPSSTLEWKQVELTFTATAATANLLLRQNGGTIRVDDVWVMSVPLVAGKIEVSSSGTVVSFTPSQPLTKEHDYKVIVGSDIKGVDGSVIDCTDSSPVGCVSTFTTGSDICQIAKVTIKPASYIFSAAGEEKSFSVTALASDGQQLSTVFNWSKTDTDNIVEFTTATNTQAVILQSNAASPKNGKATLNVTADGSAMGAGVKSAAADLEVFICEVPYKYTNDVYNFSFKYCRQRTAADKLLPELESINIPVNTNYYEILFKVGTEDVIGLRIYANNSRLAPSDWLKQAVVDNLITSPASVSPVSIDGYSAARGGQTVYVTALNVGEAGNTRCGDKVICADEYILSFNTRASSDTQNIYKQLVESWQFNTNITVASDKVKLKNDMRRVFDLQSITDLLERYGKLHSFTLPQLTAGTYIANWTNSKWKSWQQNLSAALGRSLPSDPINTFGACPTGYDPITCWNEQDKKFECPVDSYVYQYQATGKGKARLYANFEFGNVDWGGGFKVPTEPSDAADSCRTDDSLTVWQEVRVEPPYVLRVEKNNTGAGVVTSTVGGINCGSICEASYNTPGQKVTLSAVPSAGSSFADWSPALGCVSKIGATCVVSMDGPKTVTANFVKDSYLLSTATSGTGSGNIMVLDPAPPAPCCSYGEVATLKATADAGSVFTHWSGCTSVSGNVCNVTMTSDKHVVAYFEHSYNLTVNKVGTVGSITSNPVGITCSANCTKAFLQDVVVNLTATAGADSVLDKWEGCDTVSGNTCTVTMTADKSVTATFETLINYYNLNINKTGSGLGVVESNEGGIDCGTDCTESYQENKTVDLLVIETIGSKFIKWSGDTACGTANPCQVTMNASKNITAQFDLRPYLLAVYIDVEGFTVGGGTVTSNPDGINCGISLITNDCLEDYTYGQTITLTPSPKTGYKFIGWESNQVNCGGKSTCTLVMNKDITITAVFGKVFFLTVTKVGTGYGYVYSDPQGIDCGGSCGKPPEPVEFGQDQVIKLYAVANTGSMFDGWASDPAILTCSGIGSCEFTRYDNTAVTITATFKLAPTSKILKVILDPATGLGSVQSDLSGINCNPTCQASYNKDEVVTLIATPILNGSTFTGWSGGGCSGVGNCIVTLDIDKEITATFEPVQYTLNVTVNGPGTVASVPAGGIACPGDCTEIYNYPSIITLQEQANSGYNFTGWSGACTGTGQCVVTMDGIKNVTANFALMQYTLMVDKYLDGATTGAAAAGTITSSTVPPPANEITCGTSYSSCSRSFSVGSVVTLTATLATGYQFLNWSGVACSEGNNDTTTCTLTITGNISVNANFTKPIYTLTVSPVPTNGSITGTGINCPGDCTETTTAASINLFADPASGYVGSWTGDAASCGSYPFCSIVMNDNKIVSVNFTPTCYTLTRNVNSAGAGSVSANPANSISCVTGSYTTGQSITLQATPASGYTFTSWSDGTGSAASCNGKIDASCIFDITANSSITANFSATLTTVSVSKNIASAGTVTSNIGGINCGLTCASNPITSGSSVSLIATPASGYTFTSWSDGTGSAASCNGRIDASCIFDITANSSITANFQPLSYTLTATFSGSGSITGVGINCGSDCSESYVPNTPVTLTATPASGYTLISWSGGGCSGTGTCHVTMTSNLIVIATFRAPGVPYVVAGDATSVTSTQATLNAVVNLNGISLSSNPGGRFFYAPASNFAATPSCQTLVSSSYTVLPWFAVGYTNKLGDQLVSAIVGDNDPLPLSPATSYYYCAYLYFPVSPYYAYGNVKILTTAP
ncbi:MAG: InlB B-repeat-containing protein, partial [Patescibacteria group bacterium]